MSHAKSREIVLALNITAELIESLELLRNAWRKNPLTLPKGLSPRVRIVVAPI